MKRLKRAAATWTAVTSTRRGFYTRSFGLTRDIRDKKTWGNAHEGATRTPNIETIESWAKQPGVEIMRIRALQKSKFDTELLGNPNDPHGPRGLRNNASAFTGTFWISSGCPREEYCICLYDEIKIIIKARELPPTDFSINIVILVLITY